MITVPGNTKLALAGCSRAVSYVSIISAPLKLIGGEAEGRIGLYV